MQVVDIRAKTKKGGEISPSCHFAITHEGSLAPDCSRLLSSLNIQSVKYNEMDPILIGTAVSVVTYTDFICRQGTSAIKSV